MRNIIIWVVFLITLLTLTTPLIDRVLNQNTMNVLENGINNIEYFIGSDNLNVFLVMICVIIIFTIYRRANKFFHWTE
jgi:uncharacterized membrane protein